MLGRLRPREVQAPPPSLEQQARLNRGENKSPPLFAYTQRREPNAGPSFLMAPWDQYNEVYDLPIAWQEAPDPIRQSDFWAAGNKVHPQAHQRIVTHLAIASLEAVSEQTFRVGKLLGYMKRPMYQGKQAPSRMRSNIQEAVPTTYGSQFQVTDTQSIGGPATAGGFVFPTSESNDGYPY